MKENKTKPKKEKVEKDKKNKVEINNAQEEIREILQGCVKCGLCKSLCPVFKTLREETQGPRGRAILLQEDIYDKVLWQCNLCKACEIKCPMSVRVWEAVKKSREVMNLEGKELESNKEMIDNIRKLGNPFGREPDKSEKLYCC